MQAVSLAIPDVKLITPKVFGDERGFFMESFNQSKFESITETKDVSFIQDNHSKSVKNVVRGLHYQIKFPQGKLVRVVKGEVFDVAVDLRKNSPYFGKWVGVHLSEDNKLQLWIPPGFAHGFMTLRDDTEFLYKTTDYWYPEFDRCIKWDDPDLNIIWPDVSNPILSAKDLAGSLFKSADVFEV